MKPSLPDLSDEQQELFEHYHLVVDKGQQLMRIDKFLSDHYGISRNKVQNASAAGCVLVNGKAAKQNYRIKPGDDISVVLPYPKRERILKPEHIPLNIVYEDNDFVIVNKQAGLVVHPGVGNFDGTLLNALLYHFGHTKEMPVSPADIEGRHPHGRTDELPYPYLSHRIDKDTTGLIVIAKNELAQIHLARQFFDHTVKREYNALVWGDLENETGIIEGHIGRSLKDRKVMDVFPGGEQGKSAKTHYSVIERFGYVTLVRCRLETGRTHQIRVHFKYIGHPLFNDKDYGGDRILKGTTFTRYKQFVENCFELLPRQALHAKSLGFIHPSSKKEVLFDSELPADLSAVLEKWRGYVRFPKKGISIQPPYGWSRIGG